MLDFQEAHYGDIVAHNFEGKSPWLYLDTHQPPLVTGGIGCATDLDECLTLPFTVNGVAATPDQIAYGFARVQRMRGGLWYTAYRYPLCPMLTEEGIVALVQKRYDVFTPELVSLFPDFMSWPLTAKEGTLDLIWGLGEGHPAEQGAVADGLCAYAHFDAAARAQDWVTCAAQCAENTGNPAYAARNAWRKGLFLAAVTAN